MILKIIGVTYMFKETYKIEERKAFVDSYFDLFPNVETTKERIERLEFYGMLYLMFLGVDEIYFEKESLPEEVFCVKFKDNAGRRILEKHQNKIKTLYINDVLCTDENEIFFKIKTTIIPFKENVLVSEMKAYNRLNEDMKKVSKRSDCWSRHICNAMLVQGSFFRNGSFEIYKDGWDIVCFEDDNMKIILSGCVEKMILK